MVTRIALEKRLKDLKEKARPKTISTLADFVLWMANKRPGDPSPPMDPYLEEVLFKFSERSQV